MLSVLHDCQTLQLKRLHFRCYLAYNYTTITLFAAFSIVCLDLCGKAQRWWRGITWPNKQGTSGNTVSPELCAHGAYVRDPARSDALQMTLKMRFYKCRSVKCINFLISTCYVYEKCLQYSSLGWCLTRFIHVLHRPSGYSLSGFASLGRRRRDPRWRQWALSVSCNRKWEKIERERGKQTSDRWKPWQQFRLHL